MSDRGWLGFGVRTRAPQPAQQPAPSDTQGEGLDTTQQQQQQNHHKPPRLSRISSYIGLGTAAKSNSPTTPEFTIERSESMKSGTLGFDSEGLHRKNENDVFYNSADATWHNPSLKQMIETVSCEMMRNGSSAPIPRHLNGWIASILEEVSHQVCELRDLRAQFADLKETRQKELREFGTMTSEWEQREYGFKAEINRLEHIISDTQQGAESVLLVRAGSVVNRNDGRAFRAKLDRLSRSEDEDVTLDRNHDYLVENAKRNSIALSSGDVGLSMDTSPYKTLGAVPRFLEPNSDAYLSQHVCSTTSKRRLKTAQDLGAKMTAARISVALTGRPPAPSIKGKTSAGNSDRSSSSSSSGRASSSSSLITQGLLAEQMAQSQVTPRTSPIKDGSLYGRPDKGAAKGCDVLETIREMAAQNGGLPDDAIDDESSYASTPHFSRHQRAFSFDAGNGGSGGPDRLAKPHLLQRPQQSTAEEQPPSPQFSGLAQDGRNGVKTTTLKDQPSESSDSSSDGISNHSRSSIVLSMGHNHVTDASKVKATTSEGRDLDDSSKLVQMTKVMVLQRDAIANNLRLSPTKRVQERRVPRTSQFPTEEEMQRQRLMDLNDTHGRAYLSDEELALTTLNKPSCDLAQQRAQGYLQGPTAPSAVKRLPPAVGCKKDAAVAAMRALKRSTSRPKNRRKLRAQAA
ncbi:hypothetical protein VMCG_02810 [Cytospora schulzeri]|uniref:Uncharacterized protein n=1 Tax=Cytospora schulzeri TaxID=448051 RepID=A0A423WZT5_9PEZI|nr:hypothetical protein VMCG_02810 [Valsa malicola]